MVNKHRVEKFIVARPGAATPAAGVATLYNATTGTPNLAIGGFGIYEVTNTTGNHVAAVALGTVANTPEWKIIQRRDVSQDRSPLPQRTFIESPKINAACKTVARGTAARFRNNGVWIIGAQNATVGEVPINSEVEYIVNASTKGWHTDLYNGNSRPLKMGRFTTPDYTSSTLYTIAEQQRDHLLHNVAYDFNNQGWTQVIAICIDSQASVAVPAPSNVTTVSAIGALAVGSNVIIGFTDDGQAITLTIDQDLKNTFIELATLLPGGGTEQVVPYARPTAANLAVANRLVAGGQAAGVTDAEVDQLIFLSLDRQQAYYQEVPQTKERILLGLDGGFDTTTASDEILNPTEGAGYGDEVLQQVRDIMLHSMYVGGGKLWQPNHVEYGHEVIPGAIYDVYIIDSCSTPLATSGMPSISPQVTIVALVNYEIGDATSNPYFEFAGVGNPNPQKTYLETFLNSWYPTTPYGHTTIAL